MTRSKWKLTVDGDGEARTDEWGGDEAFRFGEPEIPLIALLAEVFEDDFVKLAPGVYQGPKAP